MGLAASQVRFLNLTARKNNLEFEGQQINQQRTTLANQSANYYNQMLTMSVPVPPSTASYQTIQYNMSLNNAINAFKLPETTTNVSIAQITGSQNNATIVYTSTFVDQYALVRQQNLVGVTVSGGNIYKGSTTSEDKKLVQLSDSNLPSELTDAVPSIVENMQKVNPGATADNTYVLKSGSNNAPVYTYYYFPSTPADGTTAEYKQAELTKYAQNSVSGVRIARDANNRVIGFEIPQFDGYGNEIEPLSVAVEAVTVQDTAAYEEAYNQYTYETYLYQQQLEEINAQTSIIQAQDKKLELRLKQLDTEQSAISTELESLDSLIGKNVENSFKVFA